MKAKEIRERTEYIRGLGYTDKLNCWGATLLILKANRHIEWTGFLKMEKFLREKTKNVNDAHKGLKLGDILVMRDKNDELQHTAIYVGNGRWFHKRGYMSGTDDRALDIAEDYKYYGVKYWEIRRVK